MVNANISLRAALHDFYEDYAACVDSFELSEWPSFFTEDGRYRVISAENHKAGLPLAPIYCDGQGMLKDRVTALRETSVYEQRMLRHFVSGVRVLGRDDEGRIRATANFLIIEALPDQEPQVNMVGRYVDLVVERGDGFLLKERFCVYDNWRIRNSLIMPV